jgi:hypothetical protein
MGTMMVFEEVACGVFPEQGLVLVERAAIGAVDTEPGAHQDTVAESEQDMASAAAAAACAAVACVGVAAYVAVVELLLLAGEQQTLGAFHGLFYPDLSVLTTEPAAGAVRCHCRLPKDVMTVGSAETGVKCQI